MGIIQSRRRVWEEHGREEVEKAHALPQGDYNLEMEKDLCNESREKG